MVQVEGAVRTLSVPICQERSAVSASLVSLVIHSSNAKVDIPPPIEIDSKLIIVMDTF